MKIPEGKTTVDFSDIILSNPVNKIAALVSQKSKTIDFDVSTDDLKLIIQRLSRKQKLLKIVLGIKTHAQHINAMNKYKRGFKQFREGNRAFPEYILNGNQIQRINRELGWRNAAQKSVNKNTDFIPPRQDGYK